MSQYEGLSEVHYSSTEKAPSRLHKWVRRLGVVAAGVTLGVSGLAAEATIAAQETAKEISAVTNSNGAEFGDMMDQGSLMDSPALRRIMTEPTPDMDAGEVIPR
jgi:hypothetical protein